MESTGNDGQKGDIAAIVASQVAGRTLEQTAADAGVSVSTVQRRLADAEVSRLIRETRDRRLRELLDGQAEIARRSATRLADLVTHDDPSVALRAIGMVFANAARLTQAVDVVARVAAIEDQLEQES